MNRCHEKTEMTDNRFNVSSWRFVLLIRRTFFWFNQIWMSDDGLWTFCTASPGCPGPRDSDRGRDGYLCFDSSVYVVSGPGLWETVLGPSEAWSLVTGTLRMISWLSHSSIHLIEVFSQYLAITFMFPVSIVVQNFIIRLFSLRSVHWSLFQISPGDWGSVLFSGDGTV